MLVPCVCDSIASGRPDLITPRHHARRVESSPHQSAPSTSQRIPALFGTVPAPTDHPSPITPIRTTIRAFTKRRKTFDKPNRHATDTLRPTPRTHSHPITSTSLASPYLLKPILALPAPFRLSRPQRIGSIQMTSLPRPTRSSPNDYAPHPLFNSPRTTILGIPTLLPSSRPI